MEIEQSPKTKRILSLTLEIIYLLTGEDYELVKKISGELLTATSNLHSKGGPSDQNPPESCTGPLYSEDFTISHHNQEDISITIKAEVKEETEETFLRGDELSEMEEISSQISTVSVFPTDDSSNKNPPEICTGSLFSQDSTQENLTTPKHYQSEDVIAVKVEEEETHVRCEQQSMEEDEMTVASDIRMPGPGDKVTSSVTVFPTDESSSKSPPERCTSPLYSQDCTQTDHTISHHYKNDEFTAVKNEEEKTPVRCEQQSMKVDNVIVASDIRIPGLGDKASSDGASTNNPPERCTGPLYSQDCTQTDHTISHHYKSEEFTALKDEDETAHQSMKGDNGIVASGMKMPGPGDNDSTDGDADDDPDDLDDPEESSDRKPVTRKTHPGYQAANGSKSLTKLKDPKSAKFNFRRGRDKLYHCPECEKCYKSKGNLILHVRQHTGERPFKCTECKKSFMNKIALFQHQRIHTSKHPFSCSECGKSFLLKSCLTAHKRSHTRDPFLCEECGKCFIQKTDLLRHQIEVLFCGITNPVV